MHIFIVYGQTATGKTKTAHELAKMQGADIINADSRQIYEGLNITSGADIEPDSTKKIVKLEDECRVCYYASAQNNVRVWLHDIIKPNTLFSSYRFVRLTEQVLAILNKQGRNAVLVGGSGHYLRHLLEGFSAPKKQDWKLRTAYEHKTLRQLQDELNSLNQTQFLSLNQSDRANKRRLIRHIEKILNPDPAPQPTLSLSQRLGFSITIHTVSHFHATQEHARVAIAQRVQQRIQDGAVEEVRRLLDAGYKPTDPGLSTIGCKQIISNIRRELTLEQAVQLWTIREAQYAKRQKTYFSKYPPQSSPAR